ncbi:cytidylyltransferase domain-containing protein [Pseudoclavibacter sp. CFCC 11306]|uniref:cytidylyltransferase domain-containing protein n=1 Tax=Pseudoclavibacter sp. CFCC 11306 TaxID=1564493 RepID=UPI001787A002|nr:glycosyltransferase [Pseudoclavibacter sp. CFCC 11306]
MQELQHRNQVWIFIPARGGSVSVPRKNVRSIAGAPLITYSISTALQVVDANHVLVITDDRQIEEISQKTGATVLFETNPTPPDETLDEKILRNIPKVQQLGAGDDDIVVTVQPTSPLLSASTLNKAIDAVAQGLGRSAITVSDDRHLSWTLDADGVAHPLYQERVNRQYLRPEFRETGGAVASKLHDALSYSSRIIEPVSLISVSPQEAIDIDHFGDLYVAAHFLTRRRIVIRVDAGPLLGMGHVYRALALATELARHGILFVTSTDLPLGAEFLRRYPYALKQVANDDEFLRITREFEPDLVVLDILDTDASLVSNIRSQNPSTKVLSFEDSGSGANLVDLLVSEFTENHEVMASHQLKGIQFSLLSPQFETAEPRKNRPEEVNRILVLFGGTDPSCLAQRSLQALRDLNFSGEVTVIRGLGAGALEAPKDAKYSLEVLHDIEYMPGVMTQADLALTSAGRTIIELAALGVPSVCIAQNMREMTHNHAVSDNGVEMLGLGQSLTDDQLREGIHAVLNDAPKRRLLARNALAAGHRRSNRRTVETILDRLGLNVFPNL